MRTEATSGKEGDESNDKRRARWEGANYAMTVCANGVVNVENRNYNEAGHIYSVRVEAGAAVGCSCSHATHRGAHCKHQQAVENKPIVASAATAASVSYAPMTGQQVATDGGREVERQ